VIRASLVVVTLGLMPESALASEPQSSKTDTRPTKVVDLRDPFVPHAPVVPPPRSDRPKLVLMDLRNPFVRTATGIPTVQVAPSDLKDPFVARLSGKRIVRHRRVPDDLRDPFVEPPASTRECGPISRTEDGVEIQRPKALRQRGPCVPLLPNDLRDPFQPGR